MCVRARRQKQVQNDDTDPGKKNTRKKNLGWIEKRKEKEAVDLIFFASRRSNLSVIALRHAMKPKRWLLNLKMKIALLFLVLCLVPPPSSPTFLTCSSLEQGCHDGQPVGGGGYCAAGGGDLPCRNITAESGALEPFFLRGSRHTRDIVFYQTGKEVSTLKTRVDSLYNKKYGNL